MLNATLRGCQWRAVMAVWLLGTFALIPAPIAAQNSIATGGIVGTVTDASGTVLAGAKVNVTGSTGQVARTATNSEGEYVVGNLIPGVYKVRIEATNFKTAEVRLTIRVNNIANGNRKLEPGQGTTAVDEINEMPVNAAQATVQGLLSSTQIESLPTNGHNFLDVGQLEPGVQVQDGQDLNPSKAGYWAISIEGHSGRNTRIEVDGVDISDETVGATTSNVPATAVQEFQVSQSDLDLSTELTSAGAVNVVTKSGSDTLHGEAFGAFRDSSFSSQLPTPAGFKSPFQRSQYGAGVGGPIIKDKAFFFVDGERTLQHAQAPVPISAPFTQYSGTYTDPFHEDNLTGRLDYELTPAARAFYRFSYFDNSMAANLGQGYSVYDNVDTARDHVLGLDFSRGIYTHSIRFSYLKFQNHMADATIGNSALPFSGLQAQIAMGTSGLIAGPNSLAPQKTLQSNVELKYDGSRLWRDHVVRFGAGFDYIVGAGFDSFYGNGPRIVSQVSSSEITNAAVGPFSGGSSNPFNYPADSIMLANGLGYSTGKAGLGLPAGELGPDNRLLLYLGDTWKARRTLVLTYGLRYERDTGRTDSQYPAIPQLDSLVAGLGNRVRQPDTNFAPQFGFAWDAGGNGKTVFRGGVGLFWENSLWNNVLFDAPLRQQTGSFLQFFSPCASPGQPNTLKTANGDLNTPRSATASQICGVPGSSSFPLIGNALPAIIGLQQAYAAGSPFNLNGRNPAYAGQYLTDCSSGSNCYFAPGSSMLNPLYRSPRSIQMNIGMERELRPGMVFTVNYVRNIETHYLLGVDQNHAGDVRYFDKGGAEAAIANTLSACGAATVPESWARNCLFDPATGTTDGGTWGTAANPARPANMSDFASRGLGSSTDMGGNSCLARLGYNCAFGGLNPLAPPLGFLSPVGRSLYTGYQMKFVDTLKHPSRWVESANFQLAYALSTLRNSGGGVAADNPVTVASGDQDFIAPALDNQNVNRYFGPSDLDRRHQISFGGLVTLPLRIQWGMMGHFYSPLATTLTVPNTGAGAGEIFRTDFSGDGTTQDPIPGTHVGTFERGVEASNVNQKISIYNTTVAGLPTPAGQLLVTNNLMTTQDLASLGGVAPAVAPAPFDQQSYSWLRTFDTSLSWKYTVKERFTIQPSAAIFNVFNFVNFDLPGNMMSGLLTGTNGAINGTTYAGHFANRAGAGSGVFMLGAPRQIEFGLKLTF